MDTAEGESKDQWLLDGTLGLLVAYNLIFILDVISGSASWGQWAGAAMAFIDERRGWVTLFECIAALSLFADLVVRFDAYEARWRNLRIAGVGLAVGGLVFLSELADYAATSANVLHHARIVRDKSVKRNLIRVAAEIAETSFDQADDSEQLLDEARLEALALRMLDSDGDGDDYVLRTLGKRVPAERYDDWRSRVLAGDCGVANLLCVARQDRERGGRDPAVAALVEVAAWIAGSPRQGKGGSEGLQDTVTKSAKSFGLAAPDFRDSPALETLVRAGIPVLDERWRRLPGLLVERQPTRAFDVAIHSRRGYSARRFAVEGPEGTPAIVYLELIDRVDGPRLAVVEVDRRCIYVELEELMQDDSVGLRMFPRQRGVFELRRVDDRYEVRWRKAQ